MSPDLQQKLTERLVALLEDDLAQGEDFSTLKNDKVLLSYLQESDFEGNNNWFPELKGQEIPSRFGREEISSEAFRIFYERHPEARKTKAKRAEGKSKYSRSRSSVRSKEVWRVLGKYPKYQVSNYGRVQNLERAHPDDCLKPRFGFTGRGLIMSFALRDRDGNRCDPSLQTLMTQAGFLRSYQQYRQDQAEKREPEKAEAAGA